VAGFEVPDDSIERGEGDRGPWIAPRQAKTSPPASRVKGGEREDGAQVREGLPGINKKMPEANLLPRPREPTLHA